MIYEATILVIQFVLFSSFICRYCKIKLKNIFMTVTILVQMLVKVYFPTIKSYSIIQTICLLTLMILITHLFKEHIQFNDIYAIVFYYGVVILLTVLINAIISKLSIDYFNISQFIELLIIIIQVLITYVLLKYQQVYTSSFDNSNWGLVLINEIAVVLAIGEISYKLSINNKDTFLITLLVLCSVDFITTKYMIFRMNQIYEMNLKNRLKLESEQHLQNRLQAMKKAKEEIDHLDHRMYYIVVQTKMLIQKGKIEEAKNILDKYEKNIIKYDSIINTGNPMFDTAIGIMFYELKLSGTDFNNAIAISVNEFYENPQFISFIKDLVNILSSCSYLYISIIEKKTFVNVKCSFKDEVYSLIQAEEVFHKYQKYMKFMYKIDVSLFSFVFDLEC